MTKTTLAWLRNDLRLADNPALDAAVRNGDRVVAIYIHEQTEGIRPLGGASRWWLHQSLQALDADLARAGVELVVRAGETRAVLAAAIEETGAEAVYWNRRYAPGECALDAAIKDELRERGLVVESFGANVLVEPWDIATGAGKPYSVYGPYLRALKSRHIERPLPRIPDQKQRRPAAVDTDYREPFWAKKFHPYWTPGEAGAAAALDAFFSGEIENYPEGRDFPARASTSRLSPHLRFGEISPRQLWYAAQGVAHADHGKQAIIDKFLSELAWRDFNYHQLFHRPDITQEPMQPRFAGLQWRDAPDDLRRWQQGQTGIPIVDAGMRELWETGFMQNRVRMLVASLLCKNLLVDWRLGEQWFWDCLMDADMANNPGNWQWIAGSGMDASPFFRIFNPVTQGERFDADGNFVRQWVPELAQLPAKNIQDPSSAPKDVLAKAGVRLGDTYPPPIVDLRQSRERALEAQRNLRAAE